MSADLSRSTRSAAGSNGAAWRARHAGAPSRRRSAARRRRRLIAASPPRSSARPGRRRGSRPPRPRRLAPPAPRRRPGLSAPARRCPRRPRQPRARGERPSAAPRRALRARAARARDVDRPAGDRQPLQPALGHHQRLGPHGQAVALVDRRRDDQVDGPELVLEQQEHDALGGARAAGARRRGRRGAPGAVRRASRGRAIDTARRQRRAHSAIGCGAERQAGGRVVGHHRVPRPPAARGRRRRDLQRQRELRALPAPPRRARTPSSHSAVRRRWCPRGRASASHAPAHARRSSAARPAPAREARSASERNGPAGRARRHERRDLVARARRGRSRGRCRTAARRRRRPCTPTSLALTSGGSISIPRRCASWTSVSGA